MDIEKEVHGISGFTNLELLAKQIVEGFISGMHKSPFHGFSAEFAEHKVYNSGESTKHIDWKLYAKTDKLYTKRYEEETNLRCHIIIDNSGSMHYPNIKKPDLKHLNKISFSALAAACLMQLLKKQRDAVGLSVYNTTYEYYAPEKGSERHHQMLLHQLNESIKRTSDRKQTDTYTFLHQIAEKIHRRSLIFLFTDMFQPDTDPTKLFEALQHLKYNKHDVVLFHTFDSTTEVNFSFDNQPTRFVDVETGDFINLYADTIKENYQNAVSSYFYELKLKCLQYGITYVDADISKNFEKILTTYLIERQKFA
ncbi:DUF58 domain-containing protein [Aquimarina intermedia]|uniref:Uncharacterized protein DUF58 n=1 Tax=Aquimarina intermedia TaxID=350814 RepID=A0A5S5CCY0_9FLAO|nr:DUF58 domain-containing protein [Aquimarina intermedia]TYP77225.1 uncharacterized protein DUF58 [Aquimarina intermedia]